MATNRHFPSIAHDKGSPLFNRPTTSYFARIIQQPSQALAVGIYNNPLSAHPIEPCVIVQLFKVTPDNILDDSIDSMPDWQHYIAHAFLSSVNGKEDQSNFIQTALLQHKGEPATSPLSKPEQETDRKSSRIQHKTESSSVGQSASSLDGPGHSSKTRGRSKSKTGAKVESPASTPSMQHSIAQLSAPTPQHTALAKQLLNPPQGQDKPTSTGLTLLDGPVGNVENSLCGTLVSASYLCHDLLGCNGVFFCFPDLSIRINGVFKLRIAISKLPILATDTEMGSEGCIIATTISDAFTSHTSATWQGHSEWTNISDHFSNQGVNIIRFKTRSKSSQIG
ncbi:hypothetical protein BDEG_22875 [Batrachochytrium dendrobatidis JEL423]|uniref:Velvet domain-containing protein n=2 Tax=Batrachochytrium dendrobatidis (strain JEL423) TaxID=403673 RepID=A0A177WFU0_BATDL|nr:hypothetical protein BDEG_22875 [Batrachochytrium dendrobatidis JEL423]